MDNTTDNREAPLVGSAPSEPTNQPTTDTPILYCEATGLYYVGSDGRTCEKERQVGSIAIHPAYAFQLDDEWNPVKLRAQVAGLEAKQRGELRETKFRLDAMTIMAKVYEDIARERTHERNRARDTAAALEEELHSAVLNLRHTRKTLAITDSFLGDLRSALPPQISRIIDQYLNAVCPVCTPEDNDIVVGADHPLFQEQN